MINTQLLVKRTIKTAAAAVKSRLPISRGSKSSVNIVAYHRVVADIARAERDSYYGLVVSAPTFRKHCEILADRYDVVSLDKAGEILSRKQNSLRQRAVITFDDGYLDFYQEAFPILCEFGLSATVFLPTECIGTDRPLAHDRIFWLLRTAAERSISLAPALERANVELHIVDKFRSPRDQTTLCETLVHMPTAIREHAISEMELALPNFTAYPREFRLMNWDHVKEMADAGISFGGHTENHVVLPLESGDEANSEIARSKQELEMYINREVNAFAYPNGELTPAIKEMVKTAGFKLAVSTERKINLPGTDLLTLGRFSLCEESTRGIRGVFSHKIAKLRLCR
ncbi:MAG: polysaccharide deacetylase family protein [Pyrinomonadaceae bacterium]